MHDAEVKSTAQALRGQIREAKAQLELKLMRDIKGSKVKRDAYRYNMGPQVNGRDNTVTDNTEKAEVTSIFFFLHQLWHVSRAPWPLHVSAQAEKIRALGEQQLGNTETTCMHSDPWSQVAVTQECWCCGQLQGSHLSSTENRGKQEGTLMTARKLTIHRFLK